jgi:hypothetical protein
VLRLESGAGRLMWNAVALQFVSLTSDVVPLCRCKNKARNCLD